MDASKGHSAHSPVVVSSDSATDGSDDSESVKSITESLSENAPKPILLLGRRKRAVSSSDDSSSDENLSDSDTDSICFNQLKKPSTPIKQRSKSLTLAEDDDFYHDNPKLPIYSRTSVRLDTHNIVNAVLDPELKEDKVCSMQPIDVENNAVFIVDLGKLGTLKDLYCDDMGSWQYNGVYRTWLEVDDAGYVATLGKQKPSQSSPNIYYITKKYFVHKSSSDLKKTVAILTDYDGDTLSHSLVQYIFDDEELQITIRPHGNSKKRENFIRTMPSTLKKLKNVARDLTPKFAVCEASSSSGGLAAASSAGALPRNRQQVSNIRRRTEELCEPLFHKKKDPLFAVMSMCKQSEGKSTEDHFVRIVTGAPEPMTVLCFDWTLNDIERFCTGDRHTVLSVDPTFKLGDFDVTVTTYRHLMLTNTTGNHPVMMGPLFIHQCKKFNTYHFFASSLVGLRPTLTNLRAFGTDGEQALSSALQTVFTEAKHLRCFLHFKSNLDDRLKKFHIPLPLRIEFLRDVFGNPADFEEGLVDAEDDDCYEASLCSLQKVWNDREREVNDPPMFYEWFVANCKETVKKTMLKPVRVAGGLGNPPQPFYTNDVESHNNVIKHHTKYTAQELPQFVEKMKALITTQKNEIERAVVGMGEYRVSHHFHNHVVDTRKYFQMSEKQREKALKRFFITPFEDPVKNVLSSEIDSGDAEANKKCDENPLNKLCIPQYVAERVWTDGQQLASSDVNICASPGCSDGTAWFVKSNSATHQKPFFIECKKSGQVSCEKSCLMFNSCGVCAHTVAVATRLDCMETLVNWLQKQGNMNITKLAHSGLPKGAGKKASNRRKFSTKASTKNVKRILQDACDAPYTPRVGVTTKPNSAARERQLSEHSENQSSASGCSVYPVTPPKAPPPVSAPDPSFLFHGVPSSVKSNSPCGLPPTFAAASQEYLYSHLSPGPSSLLPHPPPLIRAPVQLTMPFMYAPMYLPGQQTQQTLDNPPDDEGSSLPFMLMFIKGNISRCAGCGRKDLQDSIGKVHPPPGDLCLLGHGNKINGFSDPPASHISL